MGVRGFLEREVFGVERVFLFFLVKWLVVLFIRFLFGFLFVLGWFILSVVVGCLLVVGIVVYFYWVVLFFGTYFFLFG